MGPIWATRIWANPYGTHAEPGCTPHMAGQLQTVEIQMSRLIRIFTVYFLFQ